MVNRNPVIAVIGAGIAGLEAARQLADLGYTPVLIEARRSPASTA